MNTTKDTEREALQRIVNLAAGWDESGATGPRYPMSWESLGRLALDYARAALAAPADGKGAK